MTLSGKHYWTINVCLNITHSPEVSPVTQQSFFLAALTFIFPVILFKQLHAGRMFLKKGKKNCSEDYQVGQQLTAKREFAEKIGIKINIDVCRLIRATAQNGCPSEDRAAVMGGSFCSH